MSHRFGRNIAPRIVLAILVACSCVFAANADEISRIGRGAAIVFSPDFADPGNRQFYERLGFVYFETADWREVLDGIRQHNSSPSSLPVEVVILETHGTNGNGLKLQDSKKADAGRSYISVGALQERLEPSGVEVVILSACNSGRLLRPEIYRAVDRDVDDPLFLPATRGFVDASPEFDPAGSRVTVLRRTQSNLESLMHGSTRELDPEVASLLDPSGNGLRFAVSTMLIQLLIEDHSLELVSEGYETEKSRADLSARRAEELFQSFRHYLASRSAEPATGEVDPPSPLLAMR